MKSSLSRFWAWGLVIFIAFGIMSCANENFEKLRRNPDYKYKLSKAYEYFNKGLYDKAQLLFEDVVPSIKGDTSAERALYTYALCQYYQRNFTFGSFYFKQFYTTYPNGKYAEDALFMTAYANYKMSPKYRLDQTETTKAIEGFQLFINTFPNSKKVAECNKLIDEMRRKLELKSFESAYLYYKLSDYKSATYAFKSLLVEYPDSENAEKIKFLILKSNYKLAENSILARQKERFEETMKFYLDFVDKYPKSSYLSEAQGIFNDCVKNLDKLKKNHID
jgi:outer membrane protein assembly factor BamD